MSAQTLVLSYPRARALGLEALRVFGAALLTAAAARVAIPLPWTPVPVTLQLLAVFGAGTVLGARSGALSQLVYLALGLAGLPVFAAGAVAGPAVLGTASFGYLLAFPAAAYLAGRWTVGAARWLGALAGVVLVWVIGFAWLALWAHVTGTQASLGWLLWAGIVTFAPFDLLKAALAVAAASPLRRRLG